MKLIAIFLTAAALTSAAPHLHIARTASSFPPNCLSPERANYIVQRERVYLLKADLNEARAAGEELFADDFVQYGDSINSLREQPVCFFPVPDILVSLHSCPLVSSFLRLTDSHSLVL